MVILGLCVVVAFSSLFPTASVSAASIETVGVGVYWESSCQNHVYTIEWGTLYPGMTKELTAYIRNEGDETVVLFMRSDNWDPSVASDYMTLSWTYIGQTIEPQEVVELEFVLAISPEIEGITNFHFDIMVQANNSSEVLIGDVNGDGTVNIRDVGPLVNAWKSKPGDPNWDSRCDLNRDARVDSWDVSLIILNWGKSNN